MMSLVHNELTYSEQDKIFDVLQTFWNAFFLDYFFSIDILLKLVH